MCRRSDRRYRVDLAFHGAGFHGWQRQPGLRTVQSELEDWLGRLLSCPGEIAVFGAGRTDAGVHAEQMVAHFDAGREFDPSELTVRLQAALPPDLVVKSVKAVPKDFHARFSALERTYIYRLTTEQSPFGRDRCWHLRTGFDYEAAVRAAACVPGRHDFSAFCRAASRKPNMECDVMESVWERQGAVFSYRIRANRFLHEMVRLLVGTMADIARGRWDAARMEDILESRDVRQCGAAAPPHGLTLVDIRYPGGGTS